MGATESLMKIYEYWTDDNSTLRDKARLISEEYYSTSLKLDATAAYIGATPSELDALLSLSELDDEDLTRISDAKPPITTWMMLATASEEELSSALRALNEERSRSIRTHATGTIEERLYTAMVQVAGPTKEQILSTFPYDVIFAMVKRAEAYKALSPKDSKALKSFGSWRKSGKPLTDRQTTYLHGILTKLVSAGVIMRDSIDGDKEQCDFVLDTLEM